ncbi:MAG: hypothetical protein ABIP21_10820 [Acidimicrobiia bacterium]
MTPVLRRPLTSDAESMVARMLIGGSFLFAIIGQTLLFHTAPLMGGDARYHRGVALTMSAGSFQGEGPIHGLITYFGGLYPFSLGWGSRILGTDFDRLVSIVSWFAVLALPYALLRLGRAIWTPGRIEVALLVFLGTIGSSLGGDIYARWVYSVLPSGSNTWPLYPRDVALVLLIVALTMVIADDSPKRIVGAAVIAGLTVCVHAQLGIYTVGVLLAHTGWQAVQHRQLRAAVRRGAVTAGVAFGVSAWWWIPRVAATIESSRLFLASYPGLSRPDSSPKGLLVALGPVGLLAVPGLVLAIRHRNRARFFGVWLVALLPLVLLARATGDAGIVTERRVWFFAALPLIVCATIAAAAGFRRVRPQIAALILVPVIVAPSVFELVQTSHDVAAWAAPPPGSPLNLELWKPAFRDLRRDVVATSGNSVVLAPDNDAMFVWTQTGAQPYSSWISGSIKLGFDPKSLTGTGYLTRVHRLADAFDAGRSGVCALARSSHSRAVVLRRLDGMLGTHDVRPAARFRVGPGRRDVASTNRTIGPGTRYLDLNATDMVQIETGSSIELDWVAAASVRTVEVTVFPPTDAADVVVLTLPDGTTIRPRLRAEGAYLSFETPHGVPQGSKLVANTTIAIERVIGYESVDGVAVRGAPHAPIVVPTSLLCRT